MILLSNAASEFFWEPPIALPRFQSEASNGNEEMDEKRITGGVKYVTGPVKEAA